MTLPEKRAYILAILADCPVPCGSDCALSELRSIPANRRLAHVAGLPEKELNRFVRQHIRIRAKQVIASLDTQPVWEAEPAFN